MTFIDTLKQITSEDRRRDYGHPTYNFIRIALVWTLYMDFRITFTPIDVAWMSSGMKLAREMNTPKFDNVLDNAGYSACIGSMVDILEENGLRGDETPDDAYRFLSQLDFGEMYVILSTGNRDNHATLIQLYINWLDEQRRNES